MKYKVGDRVLIKSLDWYYANRDEADKVKCGNDYFVSDMVKYCGKIVTISSVLPTSYCIKEDDAIFCWTDEMIEGLVEDKLNKDMKEEWYCPEGYIFKDENGNIINAQKIILEKKKNRYPKTYKECAKELGYNQVMPKDHILGYKGTLLSTFQQLLICRDTYWKIAGEKMGLEKPWEPDWSDNYQKKWTINFYQNKINLTNGPNVHFVLAFPTEEMRDALYENFKELIESCKELL